MTTDTPTRDVIPWHRDPQVVEARGREREAEARASQLDADYRRLWAEAIAEMEPDGMTVRPPHDHPVWPVRRAGAAADRELRAARDARRLAEERAVWATEAHGLRLGRRFIERLIAEQLRPLQAALVEYETLRQHVRDEFGARLTRSANGATRSFCKTDSVLRRADT